MRTCVNAGLSADVSPTARSNRRRVVPALSSTLLALHHVIRCLNKRPGFASSVAARSCVVRRQSAPRTLSGGWSSHAFGAVPGDAASTLRARPLNLCVRSAEQASSTSDIINTSACARDGTARSRADAASADPKPAPNGRRHPSFSQRPPSLAVSCSRSTPPGGERTQTILASSHGRGGHRVREPPSQRTGCDPQMSRKTERDRRLRPHVLQAQDPEPVERL